MAVTRARDGALSTLAACRQHLVFAALFSGGASVLMLSYPLFMIQVYERVTTSRRLETLIALLIGLLIAVLLRVIFAWTRSLLLIRAGLRLDRELGETVLPLILQQRAAGNSAVNVRALHDVDVLRQSLSGRGGTSAADGPWSMLFVGVMFMIDWVVGITTVVVMVVLALVALWQGSATQGANARTRTAEVKAISFADGILRYAEVALVMGMVKRLSERWQFMRHDLLQQQTSSSNIGSLFNAVQGSLRLLAQGVVLAAAAFQHITADLPIGYLFPILILLGFALRPIDQLVQARDEWTAVRAASDRLRNVLRTPLLQTLATKLPVPAGAISFRDVYFAVPGATLPILRSLNFYVAPGTSLGLLGLNGSGKTTMARLMVGVIRPTRGVVRLDGIDIATNDREQLGRYVGYLPQNVALLPGTVAENIGRFGEFSDEEIVEAAKMCGIHEAIVRLPNGYDTIIGDDGYPMSGGQRQLVGLARAVVGNPRFVVLDEPNSNLDGLGEEALKRTIRHLKESQATVVLITHRPSLIEGMDQVAVLRDASVVEFGPRADVMRRMGRSVSVVKGARE